MIEVILKVNQFEKLNRLSLPDNSAVSFNVQARRLATPPYDIQSIYLLNQDVQQAFSRGVCALLAPLVWDALI